MVYVAVAELQPGHKPAEEASDSCVTQETPVVLSVHLSHRADQAPQKKKMLLPFPAPASILTAFIYPHPLLFSISYVITAAASPPPITRLFLSPLPITLLLFYIHPYDSVLLIP